MGGDKAEAFENYAFFGGMPLILSRPDDTAKMNYLKSLLGLFCHTYRRMGLGTPCGKSFLDVMFYFLWLSIWTL